LNNLLTLSVCSSEKMKIPQEVMLSLIEAAQGDIRQIINMLSTWSLSAKSMNYEEGKAL
jgi:replication factor C subunit 1